VKLARLVRNTLGIACLAAVAAWLGPPFAAAAPNAGGHHVVVLGSSTAAGWGPTEPDSAWVARFTAAAQAVDPERTVTNLAVPGYTTYHVMPSDFTAPKDRPEPDPAHNITAALAENPDAVIINLPSNDVVNGYSIAETFANYDVILARAAAQHVPVWVTTTQPRDLGEAARLELMQVRDTTFARYGDKAIDFWSVVANPDGTINPLYGSGDGIHLNNRGHGILFTRVDAKNIWGAIAVGVTSMPVARSLRVEPASPNPFRGETSLRYSLIAPTRVTVELYDLRGRRIETLEDRVAEAGPHRVVFAAHGLPSGIYFYRVQTRDGATIGKVVLLE
jgi:lysophospholipase L1-like esterase